MKKKIVIKWSVVAILVLLLIFVVAKRDYLADYFRGLVYQPSEKMAKIRDDLDLTDQGRFIFNASQPTLSGRGEFNAVCRKGDNETAVLGCYTDGNVYVYDIESDELAGIRELTTAHELLHAVWARMSEGEKKQYSASLAKVLEDNKSILNDEIAFYSTNEQAEELYVRAGTEVKKLSEDLEKHYGEIFKDQDKIVDYYNSYIKVFNDLKSEMEALKAEMEGIQAQIDEKTADYEQRAEQLNTDIGEFNDCAETVGCFNSQWAFYNRRAELVGERDALETLYSEIDELVNKYNELVKKYNADVVHSDKLNQKINSSVQPAEIE